MVILSHVPSLSPVSPFRSIFSYLIWAWSQAQAALSWACDQAAMRFRQWQQQQQAQPQSQLQQPPARVGGSDYLRDLKTVLDSATDVTRKLVTSAFGELTRQFRRGIKLSKAFIKISKAFIQ